MNGCLKRELRPDAKGQQTKEYAVAKTEQKQKARGEHQNVARAAMVITTIADAGAHGLRMTDVIEETQLGVATVHRLLSGLVAHGFLDLDTDKNRYFLGVKIVAWAAKATERYGLSPFVDSCLGRLASLTEDTVYFSLISGDEAVCVDRREGAYPIRTLTLNVGDRRPLGVGAGSLALLSFQTDDRIKAILSSAEKDRLSYGIDNDYLRQAIGDARDAGFAINNEKLIAGMSAIGVPIRKESGEAVGAISVAAISRRLSRHASKRFQPCS